MLSNSLIKNNLSPISKICIAGLFIALATILQKVIAINYIPALPFLRISLGGPAIIIFSSIFLGPFYGLLVGAGSDLLGYFALDFSGYAYMPQISAIYALLGFLPYFIFMLVKKLNSKKVMMIIESSVLGAIFIAVSLFIILNDSMTMYSTTYTFELWKKILIPVILGILLAFIIIFTVLYEKHSSKKDKKPLLNAYQLSLGLFIVELLVMVLFGTLMKGWAFGFQTYSAILICQIIVLFINVPLNIVLINLLLRITKNRFEK